MSGATPTDPWIADCIKIGIPSFVTLCSFCLNAWLGHQGHKKNLAIEKLKIDNERIKSRENKKTELVKGIIDKIAAVEKAFGRYTGVFRESPSPTEVTTDSRNILQSPFQDLSRSIDACTDARVFILLLNEANISASFEAYLSALFTFQKQAHPERRLSPIDLGEKFEFVKQRQREFLNTLSNTYWE